MSVIVVDHGWEGIRQVVAQLARGDAYVKAGIIGKAAGRVEEEHKGSESAAPMTNVRLAMIHEFGAPAANIPERSFIRVPFTAHRNQYQVTLRLLVRAIYAKKMTIRKVLTIMGFRMKWDMKNHILKGHVTPPDKPATIARKKRKGAWNKRRGGVTANEEPKTLIDTNVLVRTIDHAVVMGGIVLPAGGKES